MSLLALGLNYKNTPLPVRERAVISRPDLPAALDHLVRRTRVSEAAILSTCNRTEVYCELGSATADHVAGWLSDYRHISDKTSQYLYQHTGDKAVRHMMRVASGLDSMVIGEPQVLGQMKTAYRDAHHAGTTGVFLNRLFQYAFATAKQVRHDTAIGHSPVSVAAVAVQLARQIFGKLEDSTVLLIGAGDMIRLTSRHLRDAGVRRLIFANRTLGNAQKLAQTHHAHAIGIEHITQYLPEVDMVFSCTGKLDYIVSREDCIKATRGRRYKPVFFVDLAVPRDMDPRIGEMEDAYLYTLDDLQHISETNMKNRHETVGLAENIIDCHADRFNEWARGRVHAGGIRELRQSAWHMRQSILAVAEQRLRNGADPADVLRQATHSLTSRLLHTSTSRLRRSTTHKDESDSS